MINKVIHYIWLGGKKEPKILKKCKKTWKKYCPDYEIKRWDESNLDININCYVKEAYEAKKYAFVSDFFRFYVLYNEGGIYLDVDVKLLKPIDKFLDNELFFGFESPTLIGPGLIIGAKKNNLMIKKFMDSYEQRHFIVDGEMDFTTICELVTNELTKEGLKLNNSEQIVKGCHIYPTEVFCPLTFGTFEKKITENTVSIHLYYGSWLNNKTLKKRIKNLLSKIIGRRNVERLKKILKKERKGG